MLAGAVAFAIALAFETPEMKAARIAEQAAAAQLEEQRAAFLADPNKSAEDCMNYFTKDSQGRMHIPAKGIYGMVAERVQAKKAISARMKNPDSFELVEAFYDEADDLKFYVTYRGTNGFGAVVTEQATYKWHGGSKCGLTQLK